MSRFYTILNCDNKKTATRGANRIIDAYLQGYNIGVSILIRKDKDNNDRISIDITGGTNNRHSIKSLGTFIEKDNKIIMLDKDDKKSIIKG